MVALQKTKAICASRMTMPSDDASRVESRNLVTEPPQASGCAAPVSLRADARRRMPGRPCSVYRFCAQTSQ